MKPLLDAIRMLSVRECLQTLCASGSDRAVGRKTLLLAYAIDPALIGTQRDLAARMDVSEARISQMLKAVRRIFR